MDKALKRLNARDDLSDNTKGIARCALLLMPATPEAPRLALVDSLVPEIAVLSPDLGEHDTGHGDPSKEPGWGPLYDDNGEAVPGCRRRLPSRIDE